MYGHKKGDIVFFWMTWKLLVPELSFHIPNMLNIYNNKKLQCLFHEDNTEITEAELS